MRGTTRIRRIALRSAIALMLAGCGGGGGDNGGGGPLWVETDLAVADVDGDGRADVLTLAMLQEGGPDTRVGRLLVYRQTSTPGVFAAPDTYSVGEYPWQMTVADVDGDGRPDVFVADVGDVRQSWLLLQEPTRPGHFGAPRSMISGGYAHTTGIADLNGDGAPDLVAGDGRSAAQGAAVRYQDPAQRGSFGPVVALALPGGASDIVTGDVDGDGRADLLAYVYVQGAPLPSSLAVLFQEGAGAFTGSGPIGGYQGLNVRRLAIADANRDGRRDLFAYLMPQSVDYKGRILLVPQGPTARTFGPAVETSVTGIDGIDDAVLADLDDDGVPDVAVAGFWPASGGPLSPPVIRSRVTLLFNDGSGAFARPVQIDLPRPVSRVAAGDLDGDGRTDLVFLGEDNQCIVMFQSALPGTYGAPRPLR